MFRPIRTLFLIGIAFLGGVFYERGNARTACLDDGGVWDNAACFGREPANG